MFRLVFCILEVLCIESVILNMKWVVFGGGDFSDFLKNYESVNFKLLIFCLG